MELHGEVKSSNLLDTEVLSARPPAQHSKKRGAGRGVRKVNGKAGVRQEVDTGSHAVLAFGSEASVAGGTFAARRQANPSTASAHSQDVRGENAVEAPKRRPWLPEESYPVALRLDGGAASPAASHLGETALQLQMLNSEGKIAKNIAKANLFSKQLSALANSAKEVRAQYDKVRSQELQKLQIRNLSQSLFNKHAKEVVKLGERWKHVDLFGSHELTKDTHLDTRLSGTPLRFDQLSLKLLHVGTNKRAVFGPARRRQLIISGATDLRNRSRIALEGMLSNEAATHSCSTIVASDNLSYLSWGITSSHRLRKKLTLFARASGDDFQGRKIILQTVHTLNPSDSISPVVAIALGRAVQAGVGWTHQLSQDPSKLDNKITLKVLASGRGAYAVNFSFKGSEE